MLLRSYITLKLVRRSFFISFTLSLVFLSVEVFKWGALISGLPLKLLFPFIITFLTYFTLYFLPDGLIISSVSLAKDLHERMMDKLLFSFGISPLDLSKMLLFSTLPLFISSFFPPFFLTEASLNYAKEKLSLKAMEKLLREITPKVFKRFDSSILYIEEKKGDEFRDIFFKYKNFLIRSEVALYEGKGRFRFRDGVILFSEGDKYLSIRFKNYEINLLRFATPKKNEILERKSRLILLLNSLKLFILAQVGFFLALKFPRRVGALALLLIALNETTNLILRNL